MSRRRATLLLAVVAACGRADNAAVASRGASSVASDSTAIAVSGEWPADLGTLLVIPADTENLAVVLYPAAPSTAIDPKVELALLGANGASIRSKAAVSGTDSAHCGDAPVLRLARAAPAFWSLGVAGAKGRPVSTDSLDAMSSEDSVAFTREGARLASIVSARIASRLSGLSFSLVGLRRLRMGDTTIIAAQLVRRVNQEANPAEERTLIVAEQIGRGQFSMVHSGRSEGTEETAAHSDLIGAFRVGATLYLVVSTDAPSGSTVEILERSGGSWRVRWTRSIAC